MSTKEERQQAKAITEAHRRAAQQPGDSSKEPFEGFDLEGFWEDSDWARKSYIGKPATEEQFAAAEQALGCKLPASYKYLLRRQNGGVPANTVFPMGDVSSCEVPCLDIAGIFGVDPGKEFSLLGELGSQFMIDEWGYPDIGVAICDCPSAGHDMIFLDYRKCGPQGEPEVVHIDQESDYEITWLAWDFERFIRGLVNEDTFEEE